MRNVAVQAIKRFIINFYLQCFLYFLFGAVFSQAVQTFFPFIKFRFLAAAEENLLYYKIASVVIIINHPVGNIMNISWLYNVFDRVVNIQPLNFYGGGFAVLSLSKAYIGLANGNKAGSRFCRFLF